MTNANEANVLRLSLHGQLVGYLAGFHNGRNVLSFAESFRHNPKRPTFSLITHPNFQGSEKLISSPLARNHRLHPTLSNLLPEGALRELIAHSLKVHTENEFQILSHLGRDLPGALIAEPMQAEDVPDSILNTYANTKAVSFDHMTANNRFSLAGVQMKLSMKAQADRYTLPTNNQALGDWIIKTPSTIHKDVPLNEYTAMKLASLAGVDIPEIKLVELNKLDNLPPINLPNETHAFAIKRFDRDKETRIHSEDFAQVLVKYPHEKYSAGNYEQIGKILSLYTGDGLANAQQFARRLLVNILLANGDAHLKNWSLIYPDQITAQLSPAYDIVTTHVYIQGERQFALNLGKNKDWYEASYAHFEAWAERAGLPWRRIKPHLDDTLSKARSLWPEALKDLPMNEIHKQTLTKHWGQLHKDFRLSIPKA
ncbi:type II toxin-antitoxin system HipA family toxin [Leucothrix pacifica]|uniref:Phosphatidylinositol kinase n=1 Tax=Leucothrix pacifica TaxID=1247513 RepID=A0A317CM47_9GAMM|nr:type II toxin-antitoxin system HipA family toxin [Leucothrix pacifica]PWQ97380.1 phosphatidylinositol kinase [Leucothrix pacifica]